MAARFLFYPRSQCDDDNKDVLTAIYERTRAVLAARAAKKKKKYIYTRRACGREFIFDCEE